MHVRPHTSFDGKKQPRLPPTSTAWIARCQVGWSVAAVVNARPINTVKTWLRARAGLFRNPIARGAGVEILDAETDAAGGHCYARAAAADGDGCCGGGAERDFSEHGVPVEWIGKVSQLRLESVSHRIPGPELENGPSARVWSPASNRTVELPTLAARSETGEAHVGVNDAVCRRLLARQGLLGTSGATAPLAIEGRSS